MAELIGADKEKQRIEAFSQTLSEIETVGLIKPDPDFCDEFPIISAIRRFQAFEAGNQKSLFLDPGAIANSLLQLKLEAENKSAFPERVDSPVTFQPRQSRGGKRSAHGVFFGDLQAFDLSLPVAVKPHWINSKESCLRDYVHNWAIRRLGFHSLQSVGVVLGETSEEPAYSMTLLEEGLTTLDSIDWSNYYPDVGDDPGMQEIWRQISEQAALLHGGDRTGVSKSRRTNKGHNRHGDLAARNIAITPDGAAFMIDWESASIRGTEPRDAETRFNNSYHDLQVLLESMCLPPHADIAGKAGVGIFYGKGETWQDWWQGFNEIFFDEYKATRLESAGTGNHHGRILTEVKEEIAVLEARLKEDMQMMFDICSSMPEA